MTKRERLAAAVTIGLPLAWLVLLETGWAHRWSAGAVALDLAVLLAACAVAWAWLHRWARG